MSDNVTSTNPTPPPAPVTPPAPPSTNPMEAAIPALTAKVDALAKQNANLGTEVIKRTQESPFLTLAKNQLQADPADVWRNVPPFPSVEAQEFALSLERISKSKRSR